MRHLFKQLWKWSWVVTLPVTILFLIWGWNTGVRFWEIGMHYKERAFHPSIERIGRMEINHLTAQVRNALVKPFQKPSTSLRTIHLFINDAEQQSLEKRLPQSGKEYHRAKLLYPDGNIGNAKMKYRGGSSSHWGHYKKSIRVKTKKSAPYEGLRTFNVIIPKYPEMLNNHMSYYLSEQLGLITPKSEMIRLNLNGEDRGAHLLAEQLRETTLRSHNKMPGDMFVGELVASDHHNGILNNVFTHPGLWRKIAVNNHYEPENYRSIEKLTLLLADDSEQGHREIMKLVDADQWARFMAMEILCQGIHYDRTHNWRIYYDPWICKLIPVVWDPTGWHPNWRKAEPGFVRLDVLTSELHKHLLNNHAFLFKRYKALEGYFAQNLDRALLEHIRELRPAIEREFMNDPHMTRDFQHVSASWAKAEMAEFVDQVEYVFVGLKEAYLGSNDSVTYAMTTSDRIALSFNGRQPVQRISLYYPGKITGNITAELSCWVEGSEHTVDITGDISIRGNTLIIDHPLMARHVHKTKGLKISRLAYLETEQAYYELSIRGRETSDSLLDMAVERKSGVPESATLVSSLVPISFTENRNMLLPHPLQTPLIWTNQVIVEGIQEIARDVIIRPGTEILLMPKASLLLYGRVIAEGTQDEPITFRRMAADAAPWGVVTIKGEKANGSRFKHCTFSGGSGYKTPLEEYSAMFSVHNVKHVSVDRCEFRDNSNVDDMVHTVYADIQFTDCLFERSLLDAVDLDITTATVEGCTFINSGNDALDLMTSEVFLRDSRIQGSHDKGISIGENTQLLAINNKIVECQIGAEAKDRSLAVLYNTDLIDNGIAINAYKKNWQYEGGGTLALVKSRIDGNQRTFTADKHSHITVADSYVSEKTESSKRITIDESVDSDQLETARFTDLFRPDTLKLLSSFEHHWTHANPNIRGTHGFTD